MCVCVCDEGTIIRITFFRSNRFTYVKPHSRLLRYAAYTSKQIAGEAVTERTACGPLSSVYHLGSGSRICLKTYLLYLRAYVISTSRQLERGNDDYEYINPAK